MRTIGHWRRGYHLHRAYDEREALGPRAWRRTVRSRPDLWRRWWQRYAGSTYRMSPAWAIHLARCWQRRQAVGLPNYRNIRLAFEVWCEY